MLIFLSAALSIYGSMHFYALWKVWQVMPHTNSISYAIVLAGILLTLSPLILWQISRQNWHTATAAFAWVAYLWMGYLFLFCCFSLVFDASRLICKFSGLNWPLNATSMLLSISLLALIFSISGFISARNIHVERISIATPKLSRDIGKVTIMQISDLHLGALLNEPFLDNVLSKLKENQPDIIVATGDVVDGQGDDFKALSKKFLALNPPGGMFAVTGNHEYIAGLENSLKFLHSSGFTVLRGETARSMGITFTGVDDITANMFHSDTDQPDANLQTPRTNNKDFIVMLKHQPVISDDIPFDLQLSGHVHGGQLFPFGYLTKMVYGFDTGLTQLSDDRNIYVSRGTGTWGPPLRVFAEPEMTLITISSE